MSIFSTALDNKYKDYAIPAYTLTIDGKKIDTRSFPITSIQVDNTAKNEKMNGCQFLVAAMYDREKGDFKYEVMDTFQVGALVVVKMGYGSTLSEVFRGMINHIDYIFDGMGPVVQVECVDAKGALVGVREWQVIDNTKSAQIIKDLLTEKCGKYAGTVEVVDTYEKNVEKESLYNTISTKQDLFQYLVQRANKVAYSFCVLPDKLYFGTSIYEKAKKQLDLEWGKNIISIRTSVDISQQVGEVKVYGKGKDDQVYEASCKIGEVIDTGSTTPDVTADAKNAKVVRNRTVIHYAQEKIENQEQIDTLAKGVLAQCTGGLVTCQVEIVGMPELTVGSQIALKRLCGQLDGNYCIEEVTHRIGENGYTTSFTGFYRSN